MIFSNYYFSPGLNQNSRTIRILYIINSNLVNRLKKLTKRLYDGLSEDKAYDLYMEFFNYKKLPADDIASHLSKLKNIWNNLKIEVSKDIESKCQLPELLLICKVLGTLPEEYFSFKSSWLLMAKSDRTIENLTNQLYAYEKALSFKGNECTSQEVSIAKSIKPKLKAYNKQKNCSKIQIDCLICHQVGHKIKQCLKWNADGRPPKRKQVGNDINMSLVSISTQLMTFDYKPVSTPIINENIQSGKVGNTEKTFPYRQAVGALMYLMTGTRPDIAYAVSVASKNLENPSEKDWVRVKRIFRYLKGTLDKGIIYKSGHKKGVLEN